LYSINPAEQPRTTLTKLERDGLDSGCWPLASGFWLLACERYFVKVLPESQKEKVAFLVFHQSRRTIAHHFDKVRAGWFRFGLLATSFWLLASSMRAILGQSVASFY
jgi:hypothetical protein